MATDPSLTIEHARPSDWRRVRHVRLRALADAPDAFWVTLDQASAVPPDGWRSQCAREDAVTLLARLGDEDVGMAVGAPHHDVAGEAALYSLWVAPEARGAGAGEALVEAVADWARRAGYPRVRLDVGDHNAPAIALYARCGFTPTGRTTSLPPPRDQVREHERARRL